LLGLISLLVQWSSVEDSQFKHREPIVGDRERSVNTDETEVTRTLRASGSLVCRAMVQSKTSL
jgi:hypothetical protein